MEKIGYVTWGNAAQMGSFLAFAHLLDDTLYLRELDQHDLGAYAAIIIPDMMDCVELRAHARQLNAYVPNSGFLIVFSIRQPEPRHPVCDAISLADMSWHWMGALEKHPQAEHIPTLDDDSLSLFMAEAR